ncbi:hypothetical protein STEG23_005107 [Scotinomys teguina]
MAAAPAAAGAGASRGRRSAATATAWGDWGGRPRPSNILLQLRQGQLTGRGLVRAVQTRLALNSERSTYLYLHSCTATVQDSLDYVCGLSSVKVIHVPRYLEFTAPSYSAARLISKKTGSENPLLAAPQLLHIAVQLIHSLYGEGTGSCKTSRVEGKETGYQNHESLQVVAHHPQIFCSLAVGWSELWDPFCFPDAATL